MRPFDYTTLVAVCGELRQQCLPARFEGAYQYDRHTLILGLRTLQGRCGLLLCWHPQFARLHQADLPPKQSDTFTFSKQLQSLLRGLALVEITPLQPWERVVDLQFAPRPTDRPLWHLYLEIMGKHSNGILVNEAGEIVTAAHQVSLAQSRLRPIQTGQSYEPPPDPQGAVPRLEEGLERWREQVALIPGPIARQLVQTYRGVSTALAVELLDGAGIDRNCPTDRLPTEAWQCLFEQWQQWLGCLTQHHFVPERVGNSYRLLGSVTDPVIFKDESGQRLEHRLEHRSPQKSVQTIVAELYQEELNRQRFQTLRQSLGQKLKTYLGKSRQKAQIFLDRLRDAEDADRYRSWGDLLMANLHQWQPGLTGIELLDFVTEKPIAIPLNPEKNGVQNAQGFYKRHQKLKRAKDAVLPLLTDIETTIAYLEQVEESLQELGNYHTEADLMTLQEIQEELREQGYLEGREPGVPQGKRQKQAQKLGTDSPAHFQRYHTPSGYEVLVGRNNRQNDHLSFRLATAYDLWFHAQEIPGSHVLLRLPPGSQPDALDVQYAANIAAYYSRARHSEQVPVVYTQPQHLYKPKGHPPGLVIYKQAEVLWGNPLAMIGNECPKGRG